MSSSLNSIKKQMVSLQLEEGWNRLIWGIRSVVLIPILLIIAYVTVMPDYATSSPEVYVAGAVICMVLGVLAFISGLRDSFDSIRRIFRTAAAKDVVMATVWLLLRRVAWSVIANWFPPQRSGL